MEIKLKLDLRPIETAQTVKERQDRERELDAELAKVFGTPEQDRKVFSWIVVGLCIIAGLAWWGL